MNLKCLPLFLIIAATVTACQQDAPSPAPADAGATAGAGAAVDASNPTVGVVWDESTAPVAGTRIEIKPDPVSFCDGPRQTVDVEWDVAAAGLDHLQLWVEEAAGRRRLWANTKVMADSKRTGPWAAKGMKFIALDAGTKRVINSATVTAADCP